jgi:integrase
VFHKTPHCFRPTFFGVGGCARRIVEEWIAELRRDHLWENDDPLFPATAIGQNSEQQFAAVGLARTHWASADTVQKIFKQQFEGVGLHGFNPHSFRHALQPTDSSAISVRYPGQVFTKLNFNRGEYAFQ